MRVTHRMLAQSITRNLQRNLRSLDKRSNQLATGRVFNRPSEDPVGTYKVMKISGTGLARNEQYRRNMGEGISWLTITDDTLADAIDVVQRLRELAVYSANAIHSAEDRQAMVPEVRQLLEQLIGIGNTELAGLYIFGGYKTQEPPYKIAGSQGDILSSWLNNNSGLIGGQYSIGIALDNLVTGSYAVSTAVEHQTVTSDDVLVEIVDEYLQGARSGFFGTENVTFTLGGLEDTGGSVALEILDDVRYQDLPEGHSVLGEENDRIIRLGVRYYLYNLNGDLSEGMYGFDAGEDIYINLNRLHEGNQAISLPIGAEEIELAISTPESLTFEEDIPLVGDKLVLQLTPLFSTEDDYGRITLHKDYGMEGEDGRPSSGTHVDWFFDVARLDGSAIKLKYYAIDSASGELLTSAIEPEFSQFGIADGGTEYWDLEDILQNGVPDEELAERPACIFTVVAPGDPYYLGDGFTRLVEISPQVTVPISINGVEAFGENELFQVVLNMEKALMHNNQFALGGTVLEELQDNLDRLLKCRSEVGARMERLLITDERISSEQIYLRELRSKVEDIDMAEAITEFMMQENAYQAALSTGARIIYPSLIDFLR